MAYWHVNVYLKWCYSSVCLATDERVKVTGENWLGETEPQASSDSAVVSQATGLSLTAVVYTVNTVSSSLGTNDSQAQRPYM